MGLFKRQKAKKTKEKILYIHFGKELNDLVLDYAYKSHTPLQEIGYCMGRLCNDESLEEALSFLLLLYFKTGIFYAQELSEKDPEFSYATLTRKQIEDLREKAQGLLEQLKEDLETANDPEAHYII